MPPLTSGRASLDIRPSSSSLQHLAQTYGAAATQRRSLDVQASRLSLDLLSRPLSYAHSTAATSRRQAVPVLASTGALATPSTTPSSQAQEHHIPDKQSQKGPRILIAGAGIGGLVLAVALLKKGFDVKIFERDVTAIRGEGKYRGPIQVQSNALAALEAIDQRLAEKIMAEGCITGDRINGLCDGETGKWYVKFDTFHPAVKKGLPVTRVISRVTLQKLLAEAAAAMAGEDIIQNGAHVVDYEHKVDELGRRRVWATLEDGQKWEGDILVGADGIWSKVRRKMIGHTEPSYSEYTCYTGIADFTPPDIDTVGYRVFLGNGRYFVSSDVGGGKMQWYGFHKEPQGGKDEDGKRKGRLLEIFGDWTDMVTDLIKATPEEDVLRRDIFDRPPIFSWTKSNVVLLGDSAHAMQPNLGQGGCMAIEDGYQLAQILENDMATLPDQWTQIEKTLMKYQSKRMMRASIIHGLAGMAAIMASTYKAYLGEGLGPLKEHLIKFKIPHPGRVGGYFAMNLTMPTMLGWVLGGNTSNLKNSDRQPHCRIDEKPKAFHEEEFYKFLVDDEALLKAARADWLLVPANAIGRVNAEEEDEYHGNYNVEDDASGSSDGPDVGRAHFHGLRIARPEEAVCISTDGLVVGSQAGSSIQLDHSQVSGRHAEVKGSQGDYFVTDLGSTNGTWLNGKRLAAQQLTKLRPGDVLQFGGQSEEMTFKVKMCHVSVEEQLKRYLGGAAVPVGPAAAAAETNGSSSNGNGAGKAGTSDQAAKELVGAGK